MKRLIAAKVSGHFSVFGLGLSLTANERVPGRAVLVAFGSRGHGWYLVRVIARDDKGLLDLFW